MDNKHSGSLGGIALISAFVLAFLFRNELPVISVILVVFAGGFLLLLGVILFFAFYKPRMTPAEQKAAEADKRLQDGRVEVVAIRICTSRIRNLEIRQLGTQICDRFSAILNTLKQQPEDMGKAGMFFGYYLPTVEKILRKYEQLERSGTATEELLEAVIQSLTDVKAALEKLYRKLFEDDVLDLSVEMETLTQMCKRQGLLSDADFSGK